MYASIADLKRLLHDTYDALYSVNDDSDVSSDELALDDLNASVAEVNASLALRYVIPCVDETVIALLKDYALNLAAGRAWARSDMSACPEGLVKRCEQIRKDLAKIANGKMLLPIAQRVLSDNGSTAGASEFYADTPIMTKDQLGGW